MFFGGEPLLNLPVVYYLAERLWRAARERGVEMGISIITNGLLLTEEVVDRLVPYGLRGVKITLDGDRETHNRMRPLRGGQGTFDRIIENIRRVAGRVRVAIGGNFDASSAASYPALLQFLSEQDFADKLVKVNFKPVIRTEVSRAQRRLHADAGRRRRQAARRHLHDGRRQRHDRRNRLRLVRLRRRADGISPRGNRAARLSDARRRAQRPVPRAHEARAHDWARWIALRVSGIHRRARACRPGTSTIGTIRRREDMRGKFDRLDPWKDCGDCAFIPVCAGGCLVASHTQLGDMNLPTCHKRSFESALISLAHDVASAA